MKEFYIAILFLQAINAQQFVYPEDSQHLSYMEQNFESKFPSATLSPIPTKDNIITQGVLNLTLAVDRALLILKEANTDVTIYSPVGIASALALVLLGSNGKTFTEIASIMGLENGLNIETSSQSVHEQIGRLLNQLQSNNNLETGVKVNLATAVFLQDGFPIRPIYEHITRNVYKSDIVNVDFSNPFSGAQNIINNWVREKTNNKINGILASNPPSSTKVILCSALYFIGQWEKPFFDGLTKRRPFFPNGRKSKYSITADMMSNGGVFPYHKDTTLDCEILGFPYKGNKTTMYIVMPTHSDKEKLNRLEGQLSPSELSRLVGSTRYQKAVILFPKMKLESTVDLTNALKYIGAKTLFNKNEANLALLSSGNTRSYSSSTTGNRYQFTSNLNPGPVNQNQFTSNFNPEPVRQNQFSSNLNSEPVRQNQFTSNLNPEPVRQNQFTSNLNSESIRQNFRDGLIFTRFSDMSNTASQPSYTHQFFLDQNRNDGLTRRIRRQSLNAGETIDSVRRLLNSNPHYNENPGLYADQVIHKVYMDITETGTEAAATTSVSISRGGDVVTFRVDHPFLFFIIDEDTKLVLFWGSVTTPTPSFS